jgi:hypothetical protein
MYLKLVKLFSLFTSFFKSLFDLDESFKGIVDLNRVKLYYEVSTVRLVLPNELVHGTLTME